MKWRLGFLALIWKGVVGLVFAVTALLFFPIISWCIASPRRHKAAFRTFTVWSWVFRIICFYHIRRIYPANKKVQLPDGPFIIAPNHASYLDIFLMPTLFAGHPHVFMGKSEILSYPLIRRYFDKYNIPVDRSNKMKAARAFIQARQTLKNGWALVIFPEGGIPDHDKPRMIPFKDGAFQLAKEAKVPILPVTFLNNYKLFSDLEDPFGYCRPGIAKVMIHNLITVEEVEAMSVSDLKKQCFDTINEPLMKFNRLKPEAEAE